MTNAAMYMRCSGDGQIPGDTWDRQNEIIQKYAAANGITIASEFRDEGITGKMELEGRAGLSACLQYVRENDIKLVLIEDSTRLARDMIVSEVVVREFQKIGVRVVAASGGVDLTAGDESNPTAKLIRQILAAVSEFERCCIYLRLQGARKRKKEKFGRCEGQLPFGFKPGEAKILEEMRLSRSHGLTCEQIAESMNTLGVPARKGGKWRSDTVAKILKRDSTTPPLAS